MEQLGTSGDMSVKAPVKRASVRRMSLPAIKAALPQGASVVRQTLMPPERNSRRLRMSVVAVLATGILGGGYVLTGSVLWAFMVLVVSVPIVAMPGFILVGMVFQEIERRRRGEPLDDGHTY
jgi:hypothetical protein